MNNVFRISHLSAGFIAVLVGYTSSVAIIFQAASAVGATPAQLNSWMWALGIGMGASCIGLSLRYRSPVLTAWSTPGAALLATSLSGLDMGQAIGIFLFSSLLITLSGVTGWFQKLMQYMPRHIAAAMLAGILLRFGMDLFIAMQSRWALTGIMFLAYLAGRLWLPRYTVPVALAAGSIAAVALGLVHTDTLSWAIAWPEFTMPRFSWQALLGVGLPLFVVTMTSQNIPGLAVLRANGYQTPASPLISWTGLTGLVLAPFGGYAFNLAAITAAICMSPDADPNADQRYKASVWAGTFYLLTGVFGASVVALFAAFPKELVAAIAGLALLGTIGNSLSAALADEHGREAALVTFMATASGLVLLGIGSAFWGLILGMTVHWALCGMRRRSRPTI
ncbi:benzoate/H(+) symporter BenE family transporter [Allopusillimonas soli]|uniref:Benzoate/H(+) symporter BenE family transporter n=1 Tax=Allopusillimonas soli TaxID=659016 RepID=A0A853FAG3_9BURK|nr:benzoate/H(+) symporter BenE family transporter [Allopusillimonas soli]NYT36967.1 benzoate/H(+) symporter BenE family transporter [Allopusillimonas soli]TEA75415.1 benzoate/H(+) symporter BenE family transporter [Allopusillimonas soli]